MNRAAIGKDVFFGLSLTTLFSGLSEPDVLDLVADAEMQSRADGETIFEEGGIADHFFVVLDGHVELSVDAGEGRRSTVEIMHRGAIIGEAAVFDGGRHPVGAKVLEGASLLAVPANSFKGKLAGRFDILMAMLSSMSFRLRMLVRQIAELKLKTTAQRLGGFLLSQTDETTGGVEIRFPYDKRRVADELGMKPESLSRALAKLARLGVESRPDNGVFVPDIERLRRFCVEDGME